MNENNHGNGNGNGNGGKNRSHSSILIFLVVTLITLVLMSFFNRMMNDSTSMEITYDQFLDLLEQDLVESVTLDSDKLTIVTKKQSLASQGIEMTYYTGRITDPEIVERLDKANVEFKQEIPDNTTSLILNVILSFAPLILIWILMGVVMRRMAGSGGMMGVGKSRAKMYMQSETGVTFKDVAGQDEAKESLQETVEFLEHPEKYAEIGAKLPKGCLLVGPPGTGKTLLAKAVAGEAHVPFFSLTGSDFVEMFVGVGASRVRDLFDEAKKNAPCIIFIDEIDAIGKSRNSGAYGGNDEREQTLNQLLSEMDGFDTSKGLLILAATNRPEVLDPALLRPGRFDRRVTVEKPDLQGRIDVLKVHSKDVHMDETVDLKEIALATSGAVGSDLANMINEAAILAVKNHRAAVSQKDLLEAVEVVLVGKEKEEPHPFAGGAKDRFLPRGWPRACLRAAEGFRAGAEDHDRSQDHGRSGLRHECSGGGEVPQHGKRDPCDAGRVCRWPRSGRDRIQYSDDRRGQRYREGDKGRQGDGNAVRHVREVRACTAGSAGSTVPG